MKIKILIVAVIIIALILVFAMMFFLKQNQDNDNTLSSQLIGKWYIPPSKSYFLFNESGTGMVGVYYINLSFQWSLDRYTLTISGIEDYLGGVGQFNCEIMDFPNGNHGKCLYLNYTSGEYNGTSIVLVSDNIYPEDPPMAGFPWLNEETEEFYIFNYPSGGLYQFIIRNSTWEIDYSYSYENGILTIRNPGNYASTWTTNLKVKFQGKGSNEKMILTWLNSTDNVTRWDNVVLVRAKENKDLTKQYINVYTYVIGSDGLNINYNFLNFNYKIFEFYGYANRWFNMGFTEWDESFPALIPIDENGVIDIEKYEYSQNGTDNIKSYLTETLMEQWPQGSEIFVYNNDYYGQRIYYKEKNQINPILIGLGRDFNMTEICWLPEYNYYWMWPTDCNYIEEPEPGLIIDFRSNPTIVQTNVSFDICVKLYNFEGGKPVDPDSIYIRIDGYPETEHLMRESTGVYYLYDYIFDEPGIHQIQIAAYRDAEVERLFEIESV